MFVRKVKKEKKETLFHKIVVTIISAGLPLQLPEWWVLFKYTLAGALLASRYSG